jgi:hypothetical protein
MGIVLFILTLAAATAVFTFLIRRGFQDGDRPGDARVSVLSIRRSPAGPGGWIEVDVANPGSETALVGLRLRTTHRVLRAIAEPATARRAQPARRSVTLAEQQFGAVPSGDTGSFWLWSEREPAQQLVRAVVGTPGRLRLHSLPAARAADLSCWDEQPLALEPLH